uniref:Uncharacterized protein n=1 Tax=Chenopodium quinoa TaxID=63459 RepID=A0A803NEA5_CHEQI
MGSSNIKDILTCFSPSLDFFAVTSGDGRIKIWDTLKGQLQTEFSDIVSSEETNLLTKPENRGHLSIDYTCMKWVTFEKKKKRKLDTSFLVLGTGSGDVLALDVSAGQLKWKINDCHPGGVTAIAFASRRSCLYTSGADGMVCELDPTTGNLLRNFKASTKAVSSLSVSPDGKTIVTAASQMKIFGSDHKKIQKFTGHPGAVRCMTLSKDGKYVFSSAVGERYVAVWQVDGSKKQSASCALAMEHPSVYLDCSTMMQMEQVFMFWPFQRVDATACPMENRLKTLGIISDLDVPTAKSTRASSLLKEIDIGTTVPPKKMRAAILSMQPSDASKILNVLLTCGSRGPAVESMFFHGFIIHWCIMVITFCLRNRRMLQLLLYI